MASVKVTNSVISRFTDLSIADKNPVTIHFNSRSMGGGGCGGWN